MTLKTDRYRGERVDEYGTSFCGLCDKNFTPLVLSECEDTFLKFQLHPPIKVLKVLNNKTMICEAGRFNNGFICKGNGILTDMSGMIISFPDNLGKINSHEIILREQGIRVSYKGLINEGGILLADGKNGETTSAKVEFGWEFTVDGYIEPINPGYKEICSFGTLSEYCIRSKTDGTRYQLSTGVVLKEDSGNSSAIKSVVGNADVEKRIPVEVNREATVIGLIQRFARFLRKLKDNFHK